MAFCDHRVPDGESYLRRGSGSTFSGKTLIYWRGLGPASRRCSTLREERRLRKPHISVIFNFNHFLHDIKRALVLQRRV
ncbi:g9073 [Coccomyxa viridis]|uniref:G9073 protein n=1 Tax=Coccomyxa viridis TaxID=1274662 RepID=A0ABP1G4J5_9CHLO